MAKVTPVVAWLMVEFGLDRGQRRRRKSDSITREFAIASKDGATVALHLPSGTYFDLDSTAAEILTLVNEHGESAAAGRLADRYRLSLDEAQAGVSGVLSTLRAGGGAPAARGRRPTISGTRNVVRSWARLPRRYRRAATTATCVVLAVELALRLFPLDRVARLFGAPLATGGEKPPARPLASDELTEQELRRLWGANWALSSWVYDATCLRRALTWGWVLRARRPSLHIGLVAENDVLAHAWLSVGDAALDGSENAQVFSVIASEIGG
jgi:hypothetical protein